MGGAASDVRSLVTEAEWGLRVDLAACYRLVALFGWDDLIFTHISARVPGPAAQAGSARSELPLVNALRSLQFDIGSTNSIRRQGGHQRPLSSMACSACRLCRSRPIVATARVRSPRL